MAAMRSPQEVFGHHGLIRVQTVRYTLQPAR